jgi:hypothetical protein
MQPDLTPIGFLHTTPSELIGSTAVRYCLAAGFTLVVLVFYPGSWDSLERYVVPKELVLGLLDRYLKVNAVKRRTHSLFRQGLYWYHAIPNMRREWLVPLMTAFDRIVREHAVFSQIFGTI